MELTNFNLGNHLISSLRRRGSRAALSTPERRLSGDECAGQAEGFAAGLASAGVTVGDRVAVMLPNCCEFPIANAGTWRIGALHMPVNVMLSPREARELFDQAHPQVLVVEENLRARLGSAVDDIPTVVTVDEERSEWRDFCAGKLRTPAPEVNTATLAYTSGTTGQAKGALLAPDQIALSLEVIASTFDVDHEDCILQVLPYFHSNASLMGVVLGWWMGGRAAMLPRFDPEGLSRLVEMESVSFGACVPTIMYDVAASEEVNRDQWSSLRYLLFGAMKLPPGVREKFEQATGVRTINSYGMTEAPNAVVCDPVSEAPKPGMIGRPLPHVAVSVLDDEGGALAAGEVGELAISARHDGPYAGRYEPMLGYWNEPAESGRVIEDGTFRTGDLGVIDEDGFVALVDRKKDMISTAGNKVYPAELERVINQDPRIAEVYVVGRSDERVGEIPVAFVVPGEEESELTEDDILSVSSGELARYKQPREVVICRSEDLPRTSLGKVQKSSLREMLSSGSLPDR